MAASAVIKARAAAECSVLEHIPNIGPALAADLRLIGIRHPRELAQRDAFVLYQALCAKTGKRQDPCVLDTFMAAIDFMRGAAALPWWHYTAQRKLLYGQIEAVANPATAGSNRSNRSIRSNTRNASTAGAKPSARSWR